MRTLAKTASYATRHLSVAIAVAYALTGDWRIALGVGIVEPLVQTVAYSVHERLWAGRAGVGPRRLRSGRAAARPCVPAANAVAATHGCA
ncbi:MAG: DUF2061 domain-containing protein [Alphaproteobacteria bacterium]